MLLFLDVGLMGRRGMPREIERKFLLERIPEGLALSGGKKIRQGYILTDGVSSARIRSKGDFFYLTVKRGKGLVREEVEITIDGAQFSALWPLTEGWRLEKTRYEVRWEGWTLEIDEFEGALWPLRMVEVEFSAEVEALAFEVPAFFGREVTGQSRYSNILLARDGLVAGGGT